MTPDERDRLVRLEAQFSGMAEAHKRMEDKLDLLLNAANMGKGAFWFVTKMGGVLVLAAGAFAWVADRFHWWMK